MLLGAHMSIAGGVSRAIERGQRVACEAIQIFLKNNNQWNARPIDEAETARFHAQWKQSAIRRIIAHNAYLVNLCSPDCSIAQRSFDAMLDELHRARLLGVEAIVIHPGAAVTRTRDEAIRCVISAVNELLRQTRPSKVKLLFECTAGQGSTLGSSFEELAMLIKGVRQKSRIGLCLDTCHLFAAGHDIGTTEAYSRTMEEFDRIVGLRWVQAIHLNDSKREFGANVDRHAHIGQGKMGLEAFACFINDARFADLPGIIETPKGNDLAEDAMNLGVLRSLGTPIS